MAEHGVAVERHLGVEHHQLAVLGDRERVDLDLLGVGAEEGVVELRGDVGGLLGEVAGQAERGGDGAAVVRHEAGRGVDGDRLDLLRRVVGDGFDIHPAFGRDDHGDAAAVAVDQQREIIFLRDVDAVGDVEAVDLLALGAGLDRDERVAEHVLGVGADFVDRLGEANAALGVGAELGELALAAAAGVDLRLDHPQGPGELLGGADRILDAHRGMAGGDGDAELREQFLGLIFVDVHDDSRVIGLPCPKA